MNDALTIKSNLFKCIDNIASHPELVSLNPGSDFTRNRKISLRDILRFPILMERDCMDMELLKYFDYDLDATPTQSAYIQQRSKLIPETFKMVLDSFNRTLPAKQFLNKYILYGVDGSRFNIFFNPNDPDTYNPPSGRSKLGNNEIHVVASFRLTDLVFTDAVIQPGKKRNEFAAICDIIDGCSFDNGIPLFLTDRGFPSFNMFAHCAEKRAFFLTRAKDMYIERLLKEDLPIDQAEYDLTVQRIITRSNSLKKRTIREKPELYRYIDSNTKFDFIPPGSAKEYPITLRVVRIKLADGSYENLITNLPDNEINADMLKILYYARWGIETAFRFLKHAVGASDFHCRAFDNVVHEVWARLILFNYCSAVTALAVAKHPKDSKYTYKVNFTMAIKNTHTFLKQKGHSGLISIMAILERYICPVRPDRYFDRRHRLQMPMKFSYRH